MEILNVKNLSFSYPDEEKRVLSEVSFSINKGDFILFCGASGSGKTTLLKLIKREIAPHGTLGGDILFNGKNISELSTNESVQKIGFVFQNPDEQIVTDKVWHEIAFGLECLGIESDEIRLRTGEMASYFGIQDLFRKNISELSGGQKQLINLASVMAMHPDLLILDEPTAQLDPIAADEFIRILEKLNRELGITIILAEHRTEEVFPISSKVAVLDGGKLICFESPKNAVKKLENHPMSLSLPTASRIFSALKVDGECPVTVKEGKNFLLENYSEKKGKGIAEKPDLNKNYIIEAKNLWFRYEKNSPDILRGLDLSIKEGEILSILGGNGAGKTTLLNVLSGLNKAYKGSVKIFGKKLSEYKNNLLYRGTLSYLSQNPKNVFVGNTVFEDFKEIVKNNTLIKSDINDIIMTAAEKFGISSLLNKHPYDLSGGEQQKCAIVKVLFNNPKILILDEPTKGFDAVFKKEFKKFLFKLRENGVTIIMVTHDIEFAAEVSNRCALFFDGQIISVSSSNKFFSSNTFYTTAASRISREVFTNAVLPEEVIYLCRD